MDLNGQNGISRWIKNSIIALMITLINFIFISPNNNAYANLNTGKLEDDEVILKDKVASNDGVVNLAMGENIEDKFKSIDVFNSNINNNLTINLKGHSVKLADNTIGLLSIIDNKYSILEEICNSYVNELGIDVNNITQIQVIGTINSDIESGRISDLIDSGEMAKEVYNATVINENLSGLEFKIDLRETEDIEPETVTEKCSDLYIGESQTVQGVKGVGLVHKEIIYDGLNKSDEKVISKQIIQPVVNNVVKIGTKNPSCDGIAFLARPTKGGYLSSYFGEVRSKSIHKGIDIAKDLGESVNSSLDGKVIKAGYNNGGYGNLVVLEHEGNMKTYYAHLSDIYVNVGDVVKKNDIIGAIGNTGNSTGPHLHFELRVNDQPVDPIKYIE